MSGKIKVLLVIGCCLIAFLAIGYIRGWLGGKIEHAPIVPIKDLSNHPVYGKYSFGKLDENIIDFGIQPLGVPIGVISETISHDMVLKKELKNQGFEMRFHPFLKGADLNFFLQRGDLEVALGGDMPALSAASVFDVVIVSLAKLGFSSLVTKKHMLITELSGKAIAYPFGSNAHYSLLKTLTSEGLKENDVRLVSLNVTKMPNALAQGKIDAFITWEPHTTIALEKFKDFVVIHRSLSASYLYFARTFVDRYPKIARQIVASQLRAMTWMRASEKNLIMACEWALQAGKEFSGGEKLLSPEQYASIVKSDLLDIAPIPIIPERDLEVQGPLFEEFEFLKRLEKIPAGNDWIKVKASFDNSIINDVLSKAEEYQLDIFEYSKERGKSHASK